MWCQFEKASTYVFLLFSRKKIYLEEKYNYEWAWYFWSFKARALIFQPGQNSRFFSLKNSSFPAYLLTTFQECNGQSVELLTLHNFFRKKLRCLVLFEYEKDSREIECMFFFGSPLWLFSFSGLTVSIFEAPQPNMVSLFWRFFLAPNSHFIAWHTSTT